MQSFFFELMQLNRCFCWLLGAAQWTKSLIFVHRISGEIWGDYKCVNLRFYSSEEKRCLVILITFTKEFCSKWYIIWKPLERVFGIRKKLFLVSSWKWSCPPWLKISTSINSSRIYHNNLPSIWKLLSRALFTSFFVNFNLHSLISSCSFIDFRKFFSQHILVTRPSLGFSQDGCPIFHEWYLGFNFGIPLEHFTV